MNRNISLSPVFRRIGTHTAGFGRTVLRQPVFAVLLLIPPLTGLMIRPLSGILGYYLPDFDFSEWVPLFLALTAGFPAYLFGFLSSLILLDERDRGLLPALRVTPLSDRGLLAAKLIPAMMLSLFGTPAALALSGQAYRISPAALAAAAIIAVPTTAFYALAGTSLARNKVQGISIGKVMGLLLIGPVLLAMLPAPWRFFSLIFPSAWLGWLIEDPVNQIYRAAGGFLYVTALSMIKWRGAMKRYFEE